MQYDPKDFADENYARRFPTMFDRYAELRVFGCTRTLAVIDAFELIRLGFELNNANQLGFAAELNPYVRARFAKFLVTKDIKKDIWTEGIAVNELLQMVRDPNVRDATRLNAINSLNALCGYVQLDEATGRRVGRTLSEFQKQHETWLAAGGPTDGTPPPAQVTH